jgi:CRISPR/Cas system-associated protein Cas10 (large subunit of type III CRISPR-Cas system)
MNQEDFDVVVTETMDSIAKLLRVKGGEYAGSEDRLANFKRGQLRTGAHPYQVLWIYLSKHIDSVETFIKDTAAGIVRERSEPIDGRLDDIINYCLLMKALVRESNGSTES